MQTPVALKCILCQEEAEAPDAQYCYSHNRALEGMRKAYGFWKNAYGDLSVEEFLNRVIELPGSGLKTRQIAEYLLEHPSRWA